jgi:hypothetical protein
MSRLRSLVQGWRHLKASAKQEFLRDPNVILFERGGDTTRVSALDSVVSGR